MCPKIALSFATSLTMPYFHTLYHKGTISQKNFIEWKTPVLVFITTFARNIYCKKNWARYDEYACVFMQSNCHSCQILINPGFLNRFAKKLKSSF